MSPGNWPEAGGPCTSQAPRPLGEGKAVVGPAWDQPDAMPSFTALGRPPAKHTSRQ